MHACTACAAVGGAGLGSPHPLPTVVVVLSLGPVGQPISAQGAPGPPPGPRTRARARVHAGSKRLDPHLTRNFSTKLKKMADQIQKYAPWNM